MPDNTIAFQVRLTPELYRRLNSAAAVHNRSASSLARDLISREVDQTERANKAKFREEMAARGTAREKRAAKNK
ncbi:MAG: hypothetical protein RL033_3518 [Pseudomonadota bacterium]|jgi:predicted transcriptional regulator